MKVPTTGGNISTGKTLAFTISGTTTRKVFTVVTVTAEAITVEVGIAAEAEVTVVAVVTAAAVVTTEKGTRLIRVVAGRIRFNPPTPARAPGIAAKPNEALTNDPNLGKSITSRPVG
jgi:hypothetical protein